MAVEKHRDTSMHQMLPPPICLRPASLHICLWPSPTHPQPHEDAYTNAPPTRPDCTSHFPVSLSHQGAHMDDGMAKQRLPPDLADLDCLVMTDFLQALEPLFRSDAALTSSVVHNDFYYNVVGVPDKAGLYSCYEICIPNKVVLELKQNHQLTSGHRMRTSSSSRHGAGAGADSSSSSNCAGAGMDSGDSSHCADAGVHVGSSSGSSSCRSSGRRACRSSSSSSGCSSSSSSDKDSTGDSARQERGRRRRSFR